MGRRGGGESEREKEGTRHDTAGEVHLLYVIHLTMARSTGHRHGDGTKTRTKLQICLGTECVGLGAWCIVVRLCLVLAIVGAVVDGEEAAWQISRDGELERVRARCEKGT